MAMWNGAVLAVSEDVKVLEGNYYFPPESVRREFLRSSDTVTVCPWKGKASYYDVVVDGEVIEDGAWYYPDPREKASWFKGYIAFWRGVEIVE